jgi:anaerobic selenocysteine-containing dehydrogenase
VVVHRHGDVTGIASDNDIRDTGQRRAGPRQGAAPDVWVELHPKDAAALGVGDGDGDIVRVSSARGNIQAQARLAGVRAGVVFVPFHYGYWDRDSAGPGEDAPRAANELTLTAWDPVSKQPIFKTAAVRVEELAGGR